MRDITYPPIIAAAKTGFRLLGQRFTMTGTEHVPRTGGVLLACNHIGYVDFVYGGLAANPSGRLVRFMAKRELFDHALVGPLMRSLHHIEVDRGAGEASFRTAVEFLRQGEAVGIFPEATISRSMELKEFKTGAVRIAAEAGVPLVPVTMWGTQRMMTKDHPQGLLPREDHRDHGRRAAAPDRGGPGRRDRRAARGDDRAPGPDHPRLPRRRAAAGLLVAARVVRRRRADPRGGARAWTPRSGSAGPSARPTSRQSDLSIHGFTVLSAESAHVASDRAVVRPARVHDVDDPLEVVDRPELHGDLALAATEVDLDPGLEPVGEPLGQVDQARARPASCAPPAGPASRRRASRRSPRGHGR